MIPLLTRHIVAVVALAFAGPLFVESEPAVAPDASRLPNMAAQFYAYVKQSLPGELRWQEIPWVLDLNEGLRLAREEKRPVLLWVSGDDPLEKC